MSRTRTRRRHLNLRFAALCLLIVFLLAGAAVWLWSGRGLPGEGVEVPDYVREDLLTVNPWSRPGTPLEKIDGIVAAIMALDRCIRNEGQQQGSVYDERDMIVF